MTSIRTGGGLVAAAEAAAARIFRTASAVRRGRPVHPQGAAFGATLEVDDGGSPFGERPELGAIVRCSRSVGLPEQLPDLYGAAVRLIDVHGSGLHQDLLFVTGGRGALPRHLLLPALGYRNRTMSTIAPYRVEGRACVFMLRALPDARVRGRMQRLSDLVDAARAGALSFELSLAPVAGGAPVRIGRLVTGDPLSAAQERMLTFNPANTGRGIVPLTIVNRLRPRSYRASQAVREELLAGSAQDESAAAE